MNLGFTTVEAIGLKRTAELLARAFADYFMPLQLGETALHAMTAVDSVDFGRSPVVLLDEEPAGVALVASRGAVSRLAAMALVPEARRRGVGRRVMEHVLAGVRARGGRRMVLEVIEQNVAAVHLYEKMGFAPSRRLVGFAGTAPAAGATALELRDSDVREVAVAVGRMEAEIGWPWQLSAETIAQLPSSTLAHALDDAWVALVNIDGPVAGLRAMAVGGTERRTERAARLLRAVMARYPTEEWRMGALWPEELSDWFTAAGLRRRALTQWQMAKTL